MPEFNTALYGQQVAELQRPLSPDEYWSKMRHHTIAPLELDAAQNDIINIIKAPAETLFIPSLSKVYHSALGASVTMDIGWAADASLGLTADPNGLADGINVAAAGSAQAFQIPDTAEKFAKPLWEWVGLSEAPPMGTMITLTATLADANPASGTVGFFLPCRARG